MSVHGSIQFCFLPVIYRFAILFWVLFGLSLPLGLNCCAKETTEYFPQNDVGIDVLLTENLDKKFMIFILFSSYSFLSRCLNEAQNIKSWLINMGIHRY